MSLNLYPHQRRALDSTANFDNVGYFMDMGLGKTFVGAEKMKKLSNKVNLVVCQKSKVDDWVDHFRENYTCAVFDLTKPAQLKAFLECEVECVGVINYELAFRRPELKKLSDFTLMLDESSLIQNEETKRAKYLLKLNASHVILLSGTVVNGNYERLWSQCQLLGWPISKKTFWQHYVVTKKVEKDGYIHNVPTGEYKNIDRLKRKLADYGAIFMKTDEVFDLPEQNDIYITVPPSKEYKEFCKKRIITVDEQMLIGDMQLTARMYERMLCGQFSKEKLEAFTDLVNSTDDRLIVFYTFTEELNRMLEVIGDRLYSIVNGETKNLTAYENKTDSITFVQYQAGAMGLNLQKANKIIYYSLPDGWSEGFEQSRKRIHRIGQERPCYYYLLLVDDSIEYDILATLGVKKARTDELFN